MLGIGEYQRNFRMLTRLGTMLGIIIQNIKHFFFGLSGEEKTLLALSNFSVIRMEIHDTTAKILKLSTPYYYIVALNNAHLRSFELEKEAWVYAWNYNQNLQH